MSIFDELVKEQGVKKPSRSVFDELAAEVPSSSSETQIEKPTNVSLSSTGSFEDALAAEVKPANIFDELAKESEVKTSKLAGYVDSGIEILKESVGSVVGTAPETLAALGGGVASFFNPVPGLVGIAEGLRTRDLNKTVEAIHKTQAAFAPILQYEPKSSGGKKAVQLIGETLEGLINTPSRIAGESVQAGGEFLGANEDVTAAAATVTHVGLELAGFAALFGGLGKLGKKLEGGKLTLPEQVKFEKTLIKTAEGLKKAKLGAEAELKAKVSTRGKLAEGDLIGGKSLTEIQDLIVKGDKSVVGLVEQGIKQHGKLAMEDALFAKSQLGELIKKKAEIGKEAYAKGKANIIQLEPALKEVLQKNSGETGQIKAQIGIVPEPTELPKLFTQETKAQQFSKKPGLQVMDLIHQRSVNVNQALLRTQKFVTEQLESKLTETELNAIPFLIEGVKNPETLGKLKMPELVEFVKNPSKSSLEATQKVRKFFDESSRFLAEHYDGISFIENYVNHVWEVPKDKVAAVHKAFTTKNPFTKKRTIPSLEEGIELGLTPKVTNIAELVKIYDNYKFKSVENLKFAEELKLLKDSNGEGLIMSATEGPSSWPVLTHPALSRAVYVGKTAKGDVIIQQDSVKINPEIAKELEIIFGSRIKGPEIGGVDIVHAATVVNAFAKAVQLALNLFHGVSLTESALGAGIGVKALKAWNPVKVYNAVKKGEFEIFKNMPLAEDAIQHKVTFGALADVQRGIVKSALETAERSTRGVPIIGSTAKGVRQFKDMWDTGLWDYFHNTLKLHAYENYTVQGLKRLEKTLKRPPTAEEINKLKNELGEFTNDTFGGQNWELSKVFGNPKMQQTMQMFWLSFDWTTSVLKQAGSPFKGLQQQFFGKTTVDRVVGKIMAKQGGVFWARSVVKIGSLLQLANYTATKLIEGEGKFTWENDPGHESDVFGGYNEDGTKVYYKVGKQFTEVLTWFTKPNEIVGSKLAPVLRESVRQLTKHDPGSGFPTKFADKEFWKSLPERAESGGMLFVPFSLRGYLEERPASFMFALPASKGMSNFKTIKLFNEAIKMEDQEKKLERVRKIYVAALENKLNAGKLLKLAARQVKGEVAYDDKQLAKDILKELKELKETQAKIDAVQLYKERGILTPGVTKQLEKLVLDEMETGAQQEALKIKKR
jgi:hypothetical protein